MKIIVYLCLLLFSLEATAQSRQPIPIPYSDGHLWGLTNGKLEVIAPPQFDTSVFFDRFSNAAIASKNKKYGNDVLKTTLDNKEGVLSSSFYEIRKPIFKKVFGQDSEFKLLHIEMPDGKQGFMDRNGKIYIPGVVE